VQQRLLRRFKAAAAGVAACRRRDCALPRLLLLLLQRLDMQVVPGACTNKHPSLR